MSHLEPLLSGKIARGALKLSPPCLRSRGVVAVSSLSLNSTTYFHICTLALCWHACIVYYILHDIIKVLLYDDYFSAYIVVFRVKARLCLFSRRAAKRSLMKHGNIYEFTDLPLYAFTDLLSASNVNEFIKIRCATYLSDLCESALTMHKQHGLYDEETREERTQGKGREKGWPHSIIVPFRSGVQLDFTNPRGVIVDYASLPGIFPRILLNFLGVSISDERLQQLIVVSSQYSKGRAWYNPKAGHFSTDSSDKKARATADMHKWAGHLLEPAYHELTVLATQSYYALTSAVGEGVEGGGSVAGAKAVSSPLQVLTASKASGVIEDWSPLQPMSSEQSIEPAASQLFTSDSNFESKLYNPFSTSFNSSYFEVSFFYRGCINHCFLLFIHSFICSRCTYQCDAGCPDCLVSAHSCCRVPTRLSPARPVRQLESRRYNYPFHALRLLLQV